MNPAAGPRSAADEAWSRRAWGDVFAILSQADRREPLGPEDLERLALAAHLTGRDPESDDLWTRAHHAWLTRGEVPRAVRCAFWLGLEIVLRGETSRSAGWMARARRLLDAARPDCVEEGYLLADGAPELLRGGRGACPGRVRAGVDVRDAVRGPGPDELRPGQHRREPDPARADRRGGPAPRRGHGRGDGRRGLPRRVRARLLRGDRRLPRGLRPAPGPGVDGRAVPVVLGAGTAGAVPRRLPGPPRRDHVSARGLGGRPGRGA